ncbi:hypothetical protein KY386_00275 [Candidatus Parcubacteria bacterium]|nr:hypothetical protein [Candidatus Parcubacteria bacterium]
MQPTALAVNLLRLGLGGTFILTGYFILRSDDKWTGLVLPWVKRVWPLPLRASMITTALYDIAQGVWILSGVGLWLAALLAALHLIQVLVSAGVNDVTYRDIGLLLASLALAALTLPPDLAARLS